MRGDLVLGGSRAGRRLCAGGHFDRQGEREPAPHDGRAIVEVLGLDPAAVPIHPFDPSRLDPKARKAFPLRLAHFLTDTHRVRRELAWEPAFGLDATLAESYANDYALRSESPDVSGDAALLAS